MKSLQTSFLKKQPSAYGGILLRTRKGRARPRPLATRQTMHLVLRSSKALGDWSFRKRANELKIQALTARFAKRHGVRVLSLANVGNHLHFHIKLGNRFTYAAFIRALTSAIAMAVTGTSRWKRLKKTAKDRFWDYRPFTKIVESFRAYLNLKDYIRINEFEGYGYQRAYARWLVKDLRVETI